jgi:hypothetical protein
MPNRVILLWAVGLFLSIEDKMECATDNWLRNADNVSLADGRGRSQCF